jgi:hypothetical protein
MGLRTDARKLWFSELRSRISPRRRKNMARRRELLARPLFSPACERTSVGLAAARAEGRIRCGRKMLDPVKRREIAESIISGRKTGAETARLYNISASTVSRIVAVHRTGLA